MPKSELHSNPYQPSSVNELEQANVGNVEPGSFRRNVETIGIIVWNIPIVLIFSFAFCGLISGWTTNLLMAIWATTPPVFAIVFAYTPTLQRILLVSGTITRERRMSAWCFAALWILILAFWYYRLASGNAL
jgi:hypothetical protein